MNAQQQKESEQLLADLDDEFGLEAVTTMPNATTFTDLDEEVDTLDALLSESLSQQQERVAARKHQQLLRDSRDHALQRLRKGTGDELEKAMDRALVAKAAEALGEWKATANVGVFHRYNCSCGSSHAVFTGLMVSQVHYREKGLRQLMTSTAKRPGLPDVTLVREQRVATCNICASANGWDLQQQADWSF